MKGQKDGEDEVYVILPIRLCEMETGSEWRRRRRGRRSVPSTTPRINTSEVQGNGVLGV